MMVEGGVNKCGHFLDFYFDGATKKWKRNCWEEEDIWDIPKLYCQPPVLNIWWERCTQARITYIQFQGHLSEVLVDIDTKQHIPVGNYGIISLIS